MNTFGISEKLLEDIINIISNEKDIIKASIFGSRARGDFRKNSDIDICIYGDLDSIKFNLLIDKFNELNTPLDFDIINFEKIKKDELKNNIIKYGVIIYERKNI
ncbi:MAG: nucleotidyltransferase domain-containing protein [Clostridiales bacterium]|nr:nucleotidyltransferase domain-containing protein [Clostridiales bacterium]